jgi:hypothetical protein
MYTSIMEDGRSEAVLMTSNTKLIESVSGQQMTSLEQDVSTAVLICTQDLHPGSVPVIWI